MAWFRKKVVDPHRAMSALFDETPGMAYNLHWTERSQPDLGGALNFSYDSFAIPLQDICGTAVVVPPIPPIGCAVVIPVQMSVDTGAGRWSGQIFHAPLINPDNPSATGYDGFPAFVGG